MDNNPNTNKVDFIVPLSGSQLFDRHAYATANNLCTKFPGLKFDYDKDKIHIYGMLSDMWYAEFNKAVFQIGEFEA